MEAFRSILSPVFCLLLKSASDQAGNQKIHVVQIYVPCFRREESIIDVRKNNRPLAGPSGRATAIIISSRMNSVVLATASENVASYRGGSGDVGFSALPNHTECARIPAVFPQIFRFLRYLQTSWRSGRDSNPRYAFDVYSLSRRAPSTTRPPLRMHWKAAPYRAARRVARGCRDFPASISRRYFTRRRAT